MAVWAVTVVTVTPAFGLTARQAPALDQRLPALMDSAGIPGLSVAIIDQGTVTWSGAYGHVNDPDRTPVDDETVFAAASLSKPVFAYVVLRHADRGEFDIDRPLAEYLPYPRLEHDERYWTITARMVMSHATGMRNWQEGKMDLVFAPGEGFMYSGEGFVYLQKVLEHVTGRTIQELARQEVFAPLGMRRSSYVWQEAFAGNAVVGSNSSDLPQDLPHATSGNAAHSLLTTAQDYARFVVAVMNGEGLSDSLSQQKLEHQNPARRPSRPTPADPFIFWGLGWGIQEGTAGRAFWHWGDNGSWRCYVVAYPTRGTGVVYFSNSYNGLSIAETVAASVVADEHWAATWLDYERYDDRGRLARRAIQGAFRTDLAMGRQQAERHRAELGDSFDLRVLRNVGLYLAGRGEHDAAIAAMELNAELFPDSASAYEQLGEALNRAGRYRAAIAAYERSLALDPYNPPVAKRIDWISARVAVEDDPVTVPVSRLGRLVGQYGPRSVRLSGSTLIYQRDGNPAYELLPLGHDLFALHGLETFRLLFVVGESGAASKIIGLNFDGTSDVSIRSD